MSVSLRGNRFHYRFNIDNTRYSGPCEGCDVPPGVTTVQLAAAKRAAEAFEKQRRAEVLTECKELRRKENEIAKEKTVRALVDNHYYALTGAAPIKLPEAAQLALAKPATRDAGENRRRQIVLYWRDFTAYMEATYPEVETLAQIRQAHCEGYVRYLIDHGRYIKEVAFTRVNATRRKKIKTATYSYNYKASPKTIKEIVGVCRSITDRLTEDAGLMFNPWARVVTPKKDPEERELFTPEEWGRIGEGIWSADPEIRFADFCRPLFIVAASTGMTEGDICMLTGSQIDWEGGLINGKRQKTGVDFTTPILGGARGYIRGVADQVVGEYLFPEHAEMYSRSPSQVSYRVKEFLHSLGIVTTVKTPGRRAVSVKDLHSVRHVFVFQAIQAGVPETIIQRMVGHRTLEMTKHYGNHKSVEAIKLAATKLPALLDLATTQEPPESEEARKQLSQLAYTLPLEEVEALLNDLQNRNAGWRAIS